MAGKYGAPILASILTACGVTIALAWPPVSFASLQQSQSAAVEATVDRVIDGDSLDVHIDGRRVAVGYEDVQTPDSGQPCSQEARERNLQLAGDRVLLTEGQTEQFDRLGRRLFRAYAPDGGSIAETLVREGLGRATRDVPGADRLIALESEAQSGGVGCLWGGAGAWVLRKRAPVTLATGALPYAVRWRFGAMYTSD